MNINRNNYEEYFLLYADKELSDSGNQMVELFVQQNTDLEEEFLMLQQSVLKPDKNILFEEKDFLLKKDIQFISKENYEEVFVLYNDDELNRSQKEKTEKFASENASFKNEFNILQKVKFEPDHSIVCPDKKTLYKKENDGKVIPFTWKAMAAAVLLGIGLWTGFNYLHKNNIQSNDNIRVQVAANTEKKAHKSVSNNPVKAPTVTPVYTLNNAAANNKSDNKNLTAKQVKEKIKLKSEEINSNKKDELAKNKKQADKYIDETANDNPKGQTNNIALVKTEKAKDAIQNKINSDVKLPADKLLALNDKIQNITADNKKPESYAQNAVYVSDEKNENYVFYNITTEEFNRSKVGGFFKKVKRFVQRKSPFSHLPDDQVAVN